MTFMYGFIFGLLLISLLVHIEKWLDEQDRLEQEDFEMWDTGRRQLNSDGEVVTAETRLPVSPFTVRDN